MPRFQCPQTNSLRATGALGPPSQEAAKQLRPRGGKPEGQTPAEPAHRPHPAPAVHATAAPRAPPHARNCSRLPRFRPSRSSPAPASLCHPYSRPASRRGSCILSRTPGHGRGPEVPARRPAAGHRRLRPPYPPGDASRRRGGLRGSWQLRAATSEFGSARLARAGPRRPRPLRGGECVTVGNMFSEVYFQNTSNDYFSFPRLLCMQDVEAAVTSAGLAFRNLGPSSNLLWQEARSRPGSRELEYPGFYCILYF